MPILNYTTSIKAEKTISEIQGILGRAGAKSIMVNFTDGLPTEVMFAIIFKDEYINFKLPANHHGVLRSMKKSRVPIRLQTEAQAVSVSWRILKDWIKSQMALIESEQALMVEVFLPYAVNANGKTIGELFIDNSQKLLNY